VACFVDWKALAIQGWEGAGVGFWDCQTCDANGVWQCVMSMREVGVAADLWQYLGWYI